MMEQDAKQGEYIPANKANEIKTLSDLAAEVNDWTLHSDRDLHMYLKHYSTQLFNRTKQLEETVRDLAMEADAANVRLKNTFNQFLMLSNNQFIENRVYEEDEDGGDVLQTVKTTDKADEKAPSVSESASKSENTKDLASDSIVGKYKSALEMGIEAMKLFATMDDDETEDSADDFDQVVDIYNERPLPFIIGTREFLEDETLGLGAAPETSESSSESESDSGSYSSSDESQHSSDSRDSSEYSPRRHSQRKESVESDSSGLFGQPPVPLERKEIVRPTDNGPFGGSDRDDESNSDGNDSSESASDSESEEISADESAVPNRQQPISLPVGNSSNRSLSSNDDSDDEEEDDGLFGSAPKQKDQSSLLLGEIRQKIAEDNPSGSLFSEQDSQVESLKPVPQLRERSFSSASSSSDGNNLFGSTPKTTSQQKNVNFESKETSSAGLPSSNSHFFSASDSDDDSDTSELFGNPTSLDKEKKFKSHAELSRNLNVDDHELSDSSDEESDAGTSLFGMTTKRGVEGSVTTGVGEQKDSSTVGFAPALSSSGAAPVPTNLEADPRPNRPLPATSNKNSLFDDSESDGSDMGELFGSRQAFSSDRSSAAVSQPAQGAERSGSNDSSSDHSDDVGGLFGTPQVKTPVVAIPKSAAETAKSSPIPVAEESSLFGPSSGANVSHPPLPNAASRMQLAREDSDSSDDWSDDGGSLFGTSKRK